MIFKNKPNLVELQLKQGEIMETVPELFIKRGKPAESSIPADYSIP